MISPQRDRARVDAMSLGLRPNAHVLLVLAVKPPANLIILNSVERLSYGGGSGRHQVPTPRGYPVWVPGRPEFLFLLRPGALWAPRAAAEKQVINRIWYQI